MASTTKLYRGVFPVAPTIFDERGELDLEGQRRCIDFMIDAGSHGICILANFSEQFVLTDAEREQVMDAVLKHVAGRVPVIVTTTHFSSSICAERSRQAQQAGAAMVMIMPPYHGATFRVSEKAIFEFYQRRLRRHRHPDHDPGRAGRGNAALGRLSGPDGAGDSRNVSYFKIEVPMAAAKLRDLIAPAATAIVGPWDGEEAITLMADLDAGATGAMTGGGYPDGIRQIMDPYFAGRTGRGRGGLRALAAADQLREPAMRLAGLQDPDEGGRRDRLGRRPPSPAEGSPGHARRPDRHRPFARSRRAALGSLMPRKNKSCSGLADMEIGFHSEA